MSPGEVLREVDLGGANLSEALLVRARLSQSLLIGTNLHGADLEDADFTQSHLDGADLGAADLSGAVLTFAQFNDSRFLDDLKSLLSRSGRPTLTENVFDSKLYGADLSSANLSHADLHGANLMAVDLRHANMSGAVFARNTELFGANLEHADLREATGLTQEQVEQAIGNKMTQLPQKFERPEAWGQGVQTQLRNLSDRFVRGELDPHSPQG